MAWLFILLLAVACEGRTLHVPAEYASIQIAIDSVRDGDTVLVALGTYAEALHAPPRRFMLLGDVPPDTGDVPRPTVDPSSLPGSTSLECLHIPFGATVSIWNMGFRNDARMYPRVQLPSGIQCDGPTLDIRYCTFDSTCYGITNSFDYPLRLTLADSRFLDNQMFCVVLCAGPQSTLHASRCLFTGNMQQGGALVYANDGSVISQCVFRGSSGPLLQLFGPNLVVDSNTFASQEASLWDAAVSLGYSGNPSSGKITNNLFSDIAIGPSVLSATVACDSDLTIRNNVFQNIRWQAGTGLCGGQLTMGCANGWGASSAKIEGNTFGPIQSGWLDLAEGVALIASATVRHNTFHDMSSDTVPAVWCADGRSVLSENNFVNTRLGLCKYLAGGDSLDARNNWWGDASGPYDSLLNPGGRGAQILCNHEVLINPWLDSVYTPSVAYSPFILHPSTFGLSVFPNPFNPVTRIVYDVSKPGAVTLKVFDLLGREVALLVDRTVDAGSNSIEWNAKDLPSGMYFGVLQAGRKRAVQKMLLMR